MKLIYFFLVLTIPFFGFTQSHQNITPVPDNRLIEAHGADYINRLITDNPFLIERWNYYLDHAFFITDEVQGKDAAYETVLIENLDSVNILVLEKEQNLERAWDLPTIYKIKDTGKLLVYYSGKEFNEKLKAHLGR